MRVMYENLGVTDVAINRQTVNGVQYLVISYNNKGVNLVEAYRAKDSTYVALVCIQTADNTYGTKYIDIADKMISDAKVGNSGYSIDVGTQPVQAILK